MTAVLAIEQVSFAGDAYPESLFRLYAADRRTLFLVAQTTDGVAGYIIARVDRWGAEIVSLAVHPSARKRGIGRVLLTAAVSRMRRQKAHSIRLMVHSNNTTAALFYRQQGFRPVGRVPDYYEDGGTAIRMRLPLVPIAGSRSKTPATATASRTRR
jgi:ribosomal-protein-alanine acetyltransferase